MPALGAAAVDGLVQAAVRVEFSSTQQGYFWNAGVACGFGGVWRDDAEAAAVRQEFVNRQRLAGDDHDVVVQPSLVDLGESRLI